MAYDFPNSPSIGQVANGYTYDGEKWVQVASAPNTSGVIAIQVFTASGTYVPSPNMTTCVIECVGGGGGSGGLAAPGGTSAVGGGGGGAGAYSRKLATAATIGASQPVTVGAAGAGGLAAGQTPGGVGGQTSVGVLCVAGGGGGSSGTAGGGAGSAGAGDFSLKGGDGGFGSSASTNTIMATAGASGRSYFGGEGPIFTGNAAYGGTAGRGYGNGAGGTIGWMTNAANGTIGAPGIVVITEYGMTALTGTATGAVRYDLPQGLTTNQMAQGRANIGVAKKNYIVNGAMQVSQENGATVLTSTGFWPVDQFVIHYTTASGFSYAQVASPTPAGSPNRIRVTTVAGPGSVAAGDYLLIQQRVEGLRVADLRSGSAAAKTVTLQFGCKGPAGTYSVSLQNAAQLRSYTSAFTISAGEANTDILRSVTIALDQTGTWAADNTLGLYVAWALYAGTTFKTPADLWTAGSFYSVTGTSSTMNVNGNVFELFDVSLTEGSVAPPFQVPDYPSELALCQRYYQQSFEPGGIAAAGFIEFDWAASAAGTLGGGSIILSPTMRSAPAVNVYDVAGNPNLITVINAGGALTNGQTYNQLTATPKNLRLRLYSIAGAVGLAFQYRVSARL